MAKNTSITLGEHFEKIIANSIKTGRYASVSEVIRAGLRMVEEEERKIELLGKEVDKGIKSGVAKNFNPKKHLAKLNKKSTK